MQDTVGKPLYYLASAYSHPDSGVREERFREALKAAAWLMSHHFLTYSPICHSHPITAHHTLPGGWEFWSRQCLPMLAHCDSLLVLLNDGWRESVGVRAEIAQARERGMHILGMEEVNGGYLFVEVPA